MITPVEMIVRLLIAGVLGAAIGLERGRLERAAGLRTHALVCLGSCLFMLVSAFGFKDVRGVPDVVLDPSRIAAQVASGIGFLGAGTIILRKEIVKGLTTAASVWAVAAVGLAVGGGMYVAAVSATTIGLLILAAIKPLERRIYQRIRTTSVFITLDPKTSLAEFQVLLDKASIGMERVTIRPHTPSGPEHIEIEVRGWSSADAATVLDKLRHLDGILEIRSPGVKTTASTKRRQSLEFPSHRASSGVNYRRFSSHLRSRLSFRAPLC